ncbi:MAG TPA: AAA family ATPase [Candidatus Eremiobacteraceae bacterium]|nr:AAA family ATPase [Candidatus Eremiobacteraceae bacterium]
MFREAFGLRRDPFLDTADPAFYYETISCAHAKRRLTDCLAQGRGLAVAVGSIGAGKTTLLNAAQEPLLEDQRYLVAAILDPTFDSEAELLDGILAAFGFDAPSETGVRARKDALKRALFATAEDDGRQAVLFIDEAQSLNATLLESLRSLLNYQLDDRKLLSIVLAGQPELAETLRAQPNFSDRVALLLQLRPLAESEAAAMIDHRLRHAGYSRAQSPFGADAIARLWRHSAGLPRRLTVLARESMEEAAQDGRSTVTADDVEAAAANTIERVDRQRSTASATAKASPVIPWWMFWRRAS